MFLPHISSSCFLISVSIHKSMFVNKQLFSMVYAYKKISDIFSLPITYFESKDEGSYDISIV